MTKTLRHLTELLYIKVGTLTNELEDKDIYDERIQREIYALVENIVETRKSIRGK